MDERQNKMIDIVKKYNKTYRGNLEEYTSWDKYKKQKIDEEKDNWDGTVKEWDFYEEKLIKKLRSQWEDEVKRITKNVRNKNKILSDKMMDDLSKLSLFADYRNRKDLFKIVWENAEYVATLDNRGDGFDSHTDFLYTVICDYYFDEEETFYNFLKNAE